MIIPEHETPEQRTQRHKETINQLVEDIKKINPNAELITGQYVTELVYYTVSVVKSKIKVEKNRRSLYIKDDASKLLNYRYLTKQDAESAIKAVMPMAQQKFETCLQAYKKLANELGFYLSYNYDGDTHGIYDEYEYIGFTMDGFNFQFIIE